MGPKSIKRQPSSVKPMEGLFMNNVIRLKTKPKPRLSSYEPLRRIFYLGQVITTVNSSCYLLEVSVERGPRSLSWTLRCRMQDMEETDSWGVHGPEEIVEHVRYLGLNVSTEQWTIMGWRSSVALKKKPCEVIPLKEGHYPGE